MTRPELGPRLGGYPVGGNLIVPIIVTGVGVAIVVGAQTQGGNGVVAMLVIGGLILLAGLANLLLLPSAIDVHERGVFVRRAVGGFAAPWQDVKSVTAGRILSGAGRSRRHRGGVELAIGHRRLQFFDGNHAPGSLEALAGGLTALREAALAGRPLVMPTVKPRRSNRVLAIIGLVVAAYLVVATIVTLVRDSRRRARANAAAPAKP
ncbi:MAG: hypothetical protein IT370_28315 [Deltaproteobacteria bacterium]|nr:hypothetical protein [Deltaproteobacteria bacterium]